MLPGAVLPGISASSNSLSDLSSNAQRSDAEQQALDEQELLGSLAFSLAEQQADTARANANGQVGGTHSESDDLAMISTKKLISLCVDVNK